MAPWIVMLFAGVVGFAAAVVAAVVLWRRIYATRPTPVADEPGPPPHPIEHERPIQNAGSVVRLRQRDRERRTADEPARR